MEPTFIDKSVLDQLRLTVPLAPLHLPACIAGIEAVTAKRKTIPQVACFDTAFHSSLPELARQLPLPGRFAKVRRYGFHGLSYEFAMSTVAKPVPAKIVIAHLGNGASVVAVRDGHSVDTTMSFTPGGGIFMGTRSGDLDPAALVYLMREHRLDVDALERA